MISGVGEKSGGIILKIAVPLALLVIWGVLSKIIDSSFILPSPLSVIYVLACPLENILGSGTLLDNALVSLQRVTLGFLAALVVAIPLGIGMGRYEIIYHLFDKATAMLRPIPPLAWVPLSLAWLKIGMGSMLFIIALGAFFPILLNTIDGIRGVKNSWIEAVSMLGAGEYDLLTRVFLPGAAPTIWTGLRVGFGIAWMCVVAAEMMPGASTGLGYLIMYAYGWGQIQVVMAGMVVIGLIGLAIDLLFKSVEVKWFSWRRLDK